MNRVGPLTTCCPSWSSFYDISWNDHSFF